jgi:hypothetical protein
MKEILMPEDLTYSATERCACGAGVAFAHSVDRHEGQRCFKPSFWTCADVLLNIAEEFDPKSGDQWLHCRKMYFHNCEVKKEKRSPEGKILRTTRPGEN